MEHLLARRERGAHRLHEPVEDRLHEPADREHAHEHAEERVRSRFRRSRRCSKNVRRTSFSGSGAPVAGGSCGAVELMRSWADVSFAPGSLGGCRRHRAGGSASAASRPGTFSVVAGGGGPAGASGAAGTGGTRAGFAALRSSA